MVLCPITDSEPERVTSCIGAWSAVEHRQQLPASRWLLITQTDHAQISGEIAAHFDMSGFPRPPADVVRAIGMHDAGWARIEDHDHQPSLHDDGRPVAFFEVAPETFLTAWTDSIEGAVRDSAVGGYIVSRHFSTLGQYRLDRQQDPPDTLRRLREFVAGEQVRQVQCRTSAQSTRDWDGFVRLLQFCDILSLYLCSGAQQPVEFPHTFDTRPLRAQRDGATIVLEPSPLRKPLPLRVAAREWPSRGTAAVVVEMNLL